MLELPSSVDQEPREKEQNVVLCGFGEHGLARVWRLTL